MTDVVKAVIAFVLGVFAFGAMFLMARYVIDTLSANVTVYYPNVLVIITTTLSAIIFLSVILWGLKQAKTKKGGY